MNHAAINVRRLRLEHDLTQKELADRAGVSRPTIGTLEDLNAKTPPSLKTLRAVAKVFGTTEIELLKTVELPEQVRFRAGREFKSREQVLVEAIHAYDIYRHFENITDSPLGQESEYLEVRKLIKTTRDNIQRCEDFQLAPMKCAQALRKHFKIAPLAALPRITSFIESMGIRIITMPYNSDAFGLSFISTQAHPVIVINNSDRITVERWIFSAAHELGHLLLHWDVDDCNVENSVESERTESEANLFASELLIPQEGFNILWKMNGDPTENDYILDAVLDIKKHFAVSYQTVLYRIAAHWSQSNDLTCIGQKKTSVQTKFLKEYKIRYGVDLPKSKEGTALAHPASYGLLCTPVSYTSEEPENRGAGAPPNASFFPQGRMMALLIKAICSKQGVKEDKVAELLRVSRDRASEFMLTVRATLGD